MGSKVVPSSQIVAGHDGVARAPERVGVVLIVVPAHHRLREEREGGGTRGIGVWAKLQGACSLPHTADNTHRETLHRSYLHGRHVDDGGLEFAEEVGARAVREVLRLAGDRSNIVEVRHVVRPARARTEGGRN